MSGSRLDRAQVYICSGGRAAGPLAPIDVWGVDEWRDNLEIKLRNGGSSKVQVTQEYLRPHPHVHSDCPRTQKEKRS